MKVLVSACLLFSGVFVLNAEPVSVEKLVPPLITQETIFDKIACTRPMREGKFNISVEELEGKTVVHCYGHGGSGCTTLFGSVKKAIDLFEVQHTKASKTPITIIGAGIIGLTSAIELTRKGYPVTAILAKERYDIPSWKNAGYFALVSIKTSPEEEEDLHQIGINSFIEYQKINQGEHPYIGQNCVKMLPVYCSVETEAGVENLEQAGLIPKKEFVTLDFGNGVLRENFIKYMTYFMDTTEMMLQLNAEVARLGIPVIQHKVETFGELDAAVVFNCTGMGAKTLNHDSQMIPVRGHLVNLNSSAGDEHMEYMIYTKVKEPTGEEAYVYMFPKCLQVTALHPEGVRVNGTLGGTFIPITSEMTQFEFDALDRMEFKKMLERNTRFFWGVSSLD